MDTLRLRLAGINPGWVFGGYLLLIMLAELVTSLISVQWGLGFHAAILLALVVHGAVGGSGEARQLALALTLAPLIRILSLALPLISFPQAAWYPLVGAPLLIALWIAARQAGLRRQDLGLRIGNWRLQGLIMGGGLGLGALEYAILHPQPLVSTFAWGDVWLPALSLLIFTGFTEEIIFRGLLQTTAGPVLRRGALVYVSVLFGVLHIGYLSVLDVVFVTAVGLLFAYLVRWGGSILGVTLAHGLTNITLFLIMPYLAHQAPAVGLGAAGVIGVATLGAGLAAARLWSGARTAAPAAPPLAALAAYPGPPENAAQAATALATHAGTAPAPGVLAAPPASLAAVYEGWRSDLFTSLLDAHAPPGVRAGALPGAGE